MNSKTFLAKLLFYITFFNIFVKSKRIRLIDGRQSSGLVIEPFRFPPVSHRDPVIIDYVHQKLDHFSDADSRMWNQRYMVNTKYYKTDGPAFLLMGGEGPISRGMIDTDDGVVMMDWMRNAAEFGAIAFQLEHRYYGNSTPFSTITDANLKYLSSRQALEDSSNFITAMTKKYSLNNARWIVFGGSYAGNLAAWMREQHPDQVAGAVASSAPLQAVLDFSEYMEVVGQDLAKRSQKCFDLTKQIFDQIRKLLTNPLGKLYIRAKVGICTRINTASIDSRGLFYDTLCGPFMTVAQYGGDNVYPYSTLTMDKLCSVLTDESTGTTPLDRLVAVTELVLGKQPGDCYDVNYDHFVNELETNVGYKPWFYQKCTEFGYFKTTDAKNQPFGNDAVNLEFRIDPCKQLFGLDLDQITASIKATNQFYGGRQYFNATNVVLVNGSQDPWHALGITYALAQRPNYLVTYINGTAHCADMYPASDTDSPQLRNARKLITQQIKSWIS